MINIGGTNIKKVQLGSTPISEIWIGDKMLWPSAGLTLTADRTSIYWFNGAPYLYVNVTPTFTVGGTVTHPDVSYSYSTNLLEYSSANKFKGKATGTATITATYTYGGNTYTSNTLNISIEDFFECTFSLSRNEIHWYSGADNRTAQLSCVLKKNGSIVSGTPTYSVKSGSAYITLNTSTGLITGKATGGPCTFGCVVAYGGKNYTATPVGSTELMVADWVRYHVSVTPTSATIYTDGQYEFTVLYHTVTNGVDSAQEVTADSWEFSGTPLQYSGNIVYGSNIPGRQDIRPKYGTYDSTNWVSLLVNTHVETYENVFEISPLSITLQENESEQLYAHYVRKKYVDGQYVGTVENIDVVAEEPDRLEWIYDNDYLRIHDLTAVLTAQKATSGTTVSARYTTKRGEVVEAAQDISVKITEAPYINVSTTSMAFSANGGSQTLTVRSNVPWTYQLTDANGIVQSVSPASGSGTTTVTVAVKASTDVNTRTASLIFKDASGSVKSNVVTISREECPASLTISANRTWIYWYELSAVTALTITPTFKVGDTPSTPTVEYSYPTGLLQYKGNNVFAGKATGSARISATYSYGGKTYTSNTIVVEIRDFFECTFGLSIGTIWWYSEASRKTAQLSYSLLKNGGSVSGTPTYSITQGSEYVTLSPSTGVVTGKATGGPCRFACSVNYGGQTFSATPKGITELTVLDYVTHSLSVSPESSTIYTDSSKTFDVLYHTKTNGVDSTQPVVAESWKFEGRALTYNGNTLYGNSFADRYDFCARYGDLDSNYVSMIVKAHSYTYTYEFNISPLTVELETYKTTQLGAHYQKVEYKDGQFNRVVEDFDVVKQDYENLTWIYDNNYVEVHDITAVLTARKETTKTVVSAEYKRDGQTFTPEQTISVKITAPAPVYEPVDFQYKGVPVRDEDVIDDGSSIVVLTDTANNLHRYDISSQGSTIGWEVDNNKITFYDITSSTDVEIDIDEVSSGSSLYFIIQGK